MLDDLNGDFNRPPSRQKEPSCAVGLSSDEDNEEYPTEKIILTSGIPEAGYGVRLKKSGGQFIESEAKKDKKFKITKKFESDNDSDEYQQIGDFSEDSH